MKMTPGTIVQLKRRVRCGYQKAYVLQRHDDWHPGAVFLDRRLDGMQWWNTQDLKRAPSQKAIAAPNVHRA